MSISDKGSILYSVISKGDIILAEHAAAKGNFPSITVDILRRLSRDCFTSRKASYSYDDKYHYHIMIENGLIFLCLADAHFAVRRAFSFLLEIRNLFLSEYSGRWETAIAHQMDRFSKTLENRAAYFSNDVNSDKITALQIEIETAKNIVTENIEKLIERGEKIDILVEKTQQLSEESFQFQKKSKELKWKLWFRNIKLWICICIIVCVVIFVIVWLACGFPNFKNCKSDGGNTPISPGTNHTASPSHSFFPTLSPSTATPTLEPT